LKLLSAKFDVPRYYTGVLPRERQPLYNENIERDIFQNERLQQYSQHIYKRVS